MMTYGLAITLLALGVVIGWVCSKAHSKKEAGFRRRMTRADPWPDPPKMKRKRLLLTQWPECNTKIPMPKGLKPPKGEDETQD